MGINSNNPKFQPGDLIQCAASAPHLVYEVKDFQGDKYMLASPDPEADWLEVPRSSIDPYYQKGAREFKRQAKQFRADPPIPGFDDDGCPTFE